MVVAGWECGCIMLPCPLLSLLSDAWLLHGARHSHPCVVPGVHTDRLNALLFHFPPSTACAGLAVTGCVGAAVTPRSVPEPAFPFHRRGCVSSFPFSLALLPVFLFVEKVDFLPLFGIQPEIYLSLFSEPPAC